MIIIYAIDCLYIYYPPHGFYCCHYEEEKARFGIITSSTTTVSEIETVDVAKLKTYLKSQKSLEEHWHEIQILRDKSLELKQIYYQDIAKIYAKKFSKQWRNIGLNDIWFALFEFTPIASGKTKADVERLSRFFRLHNNNLYIISILKANSK